MSAARFASHPMLRPGVALLVHMYDNDSVKRNPETQPSPAASDGSLSACPCILEQGSRKPFCNPSAQKPYKLPGLS